MKTEIKIAIADDHTIFRKSFISYLNQLGFNNILFDAANAKEVFENLKSKIPDILFLDIRMPDTTDTETLEKLKDLYPDVKVIILSSFYEDDIIIRFIKKGSNAFLSKACDFDVLSKTIETVYEKGVYYDEKTLSLMPKILDTNTFGNKHKNKDGLTERECAIMIMLFNNLSRSQISNKLSISKRTFDRHRDNIKTKTGCHTILEIEKYVKENNIAH